METELGAEHFEEKLEQMVALYQLPLLRLCYAYLHDEELAKDAVQETFLKAYRALPAFRKEASEKAWLNRIAINTCKDIRRSGWFRHVDRRITPDKLPEATAPVRQSDLNLTVEIMKLPVKYREVALLCWYQGLTCAETAEALQITHQAVSSRLKRARHKLRIAMEGCEEE